MPYRKNILLIGISFICLIYLLVGLLFRPIICNDAINGMLSLHNYLNYGEWNKVLNIDNNGILHTNVLTWWAPGQYEIPYLFSRLFFVNLGTAVVLLMFISLTAGCFMYYRLLKFGGFTERLIFLSLAILLLQRFINIYFLQYNSSDLLLFALAPAYLLAYLKLIKNYPDRLLSRLFLLTLFNLTGCFIKNSFILFALAVNLFTFYELFLRSSNHRHKPINLIQRLVVFIPFALANSLNYYFFLRLGTNPSNSYGILLSSTNILTGLFSPLTETLFASLSISGIYGNFYNKINLPVVAINVVMLLAILMFIYFIYRNRCVLTGKLKTDILFRFVISGISLYVLYWMFFTVMQSAISNEDRLFLPITILVLPYLIRSTQISRSKLKYVYIAFVGISVIYGASTFVYRIKRYTKDHSVNSKNEYLNGFKVYADDLDAGCNLANISRFIMSQSKDAIVVVTSPEIAFQLTVKNRFLTTLFYPPAILQNGHKANCLLIVEEGKDKVSANYKKIFSAGNYSIYK